MQFGYDENKIRTKPAYSGQKGICPLCDGTLIGKCGDIYVWHWQHHQDRECDPWKEHETDWHRKWKLNFPNDWQEVIIEKYGEKHIADVKTSKGLVIEFQNSSISTSTIQIRECFYEDMIWVINAKSFKNNFQLRSVVNSRLRNIESNALHELSSISIEYDKELKTIQDSLDKNVKDAADKHISINYKRKAVEKLDELLKQFDTFSENVINKWKQDEYYWNLNTSDITNKIESSIRSELQEIPKSIDKLQSEINLKNQTLKTIEQFEDFKINETTFKIVAYEQINSKDYYKTKAISKQSRNTFFPEITNFKTETEFLSFQYKKGQFDFAIDPADTINSLTTKIQEETNAILDLENSLPDIISKIKDQLSKELKLKIESIQNEILQLDNEWNELIKQNSRLTERKAKVSQVKTQDVLESILEIEKKKNDQRFKIMKEKKGLYTFEWKHERKSWQVADNAIFFDIGESYLFEKVSDGIFKKTIISEFISKHLDK
jgi:competence CoiA-like predicted nuclease